MPGDAHVDAGAPDAAGDGLACNGDPLLCDRRYDQISYPTTHNAMSASAEGWTHSDQRHGIARQLQDGIRGLMLDVHSYQGEPHLCHGSACASGRRRLVDGLRDIATFMTEHPREVVTLIFEPYVSPAEIHAANLLDRARRCQEESGRRVSFVTVGFYDVGTWSRWCAR